MNVGEFTFRNGKGEAITVRVEIDPDKVGRYLADRIVRRDGSKRVTALDGGVVGVRTDPIGRNPL